MLYKCFQCDLFYKENKLEKLKCQRHYVCEACFQKNNNKYCQTCQVGIVQISEQNQILHNYPVQGTMVNFHATFNPEGQSEFSSRRNCYGRLASWTMIMFLSIAFFFSGLAMAINGSERGAGVIMTIIGLVGTFFSIFFICKIRKVDRQRDSDVAADQDRFIYIKQERRVISSAASDRIQVLPS